MDADAIVVGGGLAGLVAAAELIEAGTQGHPARSGAGAVAGRPGLLVVRRPVLRRLARAAAHAHPRHRTISRCRTGWARPASTARRTTGRASGPRPTSPSPPARSAPGCTPGACAGFPIVGWAERGGYHATGHGNSVPRFHVTWGTGPGIIAPFVAARARGREAGPRLAALPPSRQRLHHHGRRRRRRARRHPGAERASSAARRARAPWSAISSSRRRPSSSPPAASAATSIWCARTGRSGWASRPSA